MIHRVSYPDDDDDMKNLTACIIRRYMRLTRAYLLAYDKGLDIVAAEEWLTQRRSLIAASNRLLLGATPDIELDENAVDDAYHDYVYVEDDDTPEYQELYDDGVDVDAEF